MTLKFALTLGDANELCEDEKRKKKEPISCFDLSRTFVRLQDFHYF